MERFNKTVTAKRISKDVTEDKINLNCIIQRGEAWNLYQKSLLIHSMLSDFPIPALFAQEHEGDNLLYILDGKQRILTISQYLTDGFILHDNTPKFNGQKIAGLKFSELEEEAQDKIKDFNLLIYYFRNMTEQERDEMFLRLNNGKALSRIELTRVEAGEEFMEYIRDIAKNPFFQNCNFTASALNKFVDEEVILHCINMLLYDGMDGLSGKVISDMVKDLKVNGLTEVDKKNLTDTIEFLNIAFTEKEKFLKKVNIPIVFFVALQYKDNIQPTEFYLKVKDFFKSPTEEYKKAAQTASAKAENVQIRIEELSNYIEQFLISEQEQEEEPEEEFQEEKQEENFIDEEQDAIHELEQQYGTEFAQLGI
jgi:hypothetical protein